MGKEGEAHVDNMVMFPLCDTILLRSMRAGNLVGNAEFMEVGMEMLIFTSQSDWTEIIFLLNLRSTRD
jgi:hypothetical protein